MSSNLTLGNKTLNTGQENWARTVHRHTYFVVYLQYLSIQLNVFLKIINISQVSKNLYQCYMIVTYLSWTPSNYFHMNQTNFLKLKFHLKIGIVDIMFLRLLRYNFPLTFYYFWNRMSLNSITVFQVILMFEIHP